MEVNHWMRWDESSVQVEGRCGWVESGPI